jgi:hypothetical protein
MSLPKILYVQSNFLVLASAFSFHILSSEMKPKSTITKFLFNPGAIFFAIIAASIGIVQLPQKLS